MSEPDFFHKFRGVVDDRLLDDPRLSLELRLSLAEAVAGGHITPEQAAKRVVERVEENDSWEEGEHQGPPEVPMAKGGKDVPPPSSEEASAPTPAGPSSTDSEAADFTAGDDAASEDAVETPELPPALSPAAKANGRTEQSADAARESQEPLEPPEDKDVEPITPEEIGSLSGKVTTAAALADEEIPPEPPLAAAPGGPTPPPGLRFDHGWERTVVPSDPAIRDWEKIRDASSLVPLPLSDDAADAWSRIEISWFSHDGPHRRYEYLLRKGHLGAPCFLYPSLHPEPLHQLLLELGFPEEVAHREAVRRQRAIEGEPVEVVERLREHEERHQEVKDSFSRAFVEAQKRKGKR